MDLKQYYIHRKENGNILFTFEEITINKRKWWIIIPIVLDLFLLLFELAVFNSCYYQIVAVPVCIIYLIYLFYLLVKSNENKEQKIIEELLKDNIINFIKQQGDNIVDLGHRYCIATENSMPNKLEVILSNGIMVYFDTYVITSINNKVTIEINVTPQLMDLTKSN